MAAQRAESPVARRSGRRLVRRRGGGGFRLFLSNSGGASGRVERVASADVVPDLDNRPGLANALQKRFGIKCRDTQNGTISSSRRAKWTHSEARSSRS